MTYTLAQIRQAGKEGEVNHLDVEHIIDLLKEQPKSDGQKEPLYRWVRASERLPKLLNEVPLLISEIPTGGYFNQYDGVLHCYTDLCNPIPEHDFDRIEWLCKVETPEQDELKKDFIEGLGENEYYDLSDLSDEQKKEFVQGFMTTVGKDFLKVFLGLALKTHMEAMIIDDVSKREFILSFKKLTEPCSHERTYSNVDGFAYCDKCGIPMQ